MPCKNQTTQFFTMITTALNCQIRIGEEGEEEVKAAVATFSEAKTKGAKMVSKISTTTKNYQYH